jgi:hypothetical protein
MHATHLSTLSLFTNPSLSEPSIGYQPHLYFWDIVTFLRNILLSVIIVFLDSSSLDGNYQQGLAALLVFLCSTGLHFCYLPYTDKELNYLEALGLIVSMMTLYFGLWTFTITSDISIIAASVLIFIINIIWLLCVMGVLFSSVGKIFKRMGDYLYQLPCACACKRGVSSAMSSSPSPVLSADVVAEMGVMSSTHSKVREEIEISKVNPLHEGRFIHEASKNSKQEVHPSNYIWHRSYFLMHI